MVAAALALAAACAPSRDAATRDPASSGQDMVARIDTMTPPDQIAYLHGLEASGQGDASVYFHLGNSFYALSQFDSAVANYDKALRADSLYTKAWVNLGLAYDSQGQVDASRRAFESALAVDPKDVLALCHLGFTYFTRGRVDTAIQYYLDALSVDPNSAQAHYNLGLAFADAKVFKEALTEWQKVVELDPEGELGKAAAENVELIKTYLELDE